MGEGWREVLKACEDIVKKVKSLLRGWGEEGCGGGVRRGEVGCGCEGGEAVHILKVIGCVLCKAFCMPVV